MLGSGDTELGAGEAGGLPGLGLGLPLSLLPGCWPWDVSGRAWGSSGTPPTPVLHGDLGVGCRGDGKGSIQDFFANAHLGFWKLN